MRTVKVTQLFEVGMGVRMGIETEIIIENDAEAEAKGKEAAEFLNEFSVGFTGGHDS